MMNVYSFYQQAFVFVLQVPAKLLFYIVTTIVRKLIFDFFVYFKAKQLFSIPIYFCFQVQSLIITFISDKIFFLIDSIFLYYLFSQTYHCFNYLFDQLFFSMRFSFQFTIVYYLAFVTSPCILLNISQKIVQLLQI